MRRELQMYLFKETFLVQLQWIFKKRKPSNLILKLYPVIWKHLPLHMNPLFLRCLKPALVEIGQLVMTKNQSKFHQERVWQTDTGRLVIRRGRSSTCSNLKKNLLFLSHTHPTPPPHTHTQNKNHQPLIWTYACVYRN